MLKLIFKNIIASRRRYLWILLELCIATTISWFLLDRVLVTEYVNLVPAGYDRDRLVRFDFHEIPARALPAGQEERDIDQKMADVKRILDIIRSDSRVESATFTGHQIFDGWSIYANSVMNNEWADSTNSYLGYVQVYFWRDTDFFRTFGLKDASGSELKDFEEQPMSKSQTIISKALANFLFPGENPVGRSIYEKSPNFSPESDKGLIAGVINDAIYRSNYDRFPIAFNPKNNKDVERGGGINYLHGVIRLKDGIDVEKFARDYSPKLTQELRFGEIYCSSLEPYSYQTELMTRDKKNENFVLESIALFFFVNILLCMTGTFYLQTRRRSEEAGVMRSFGATRGFIIREMMGEGFILVTLAWIIGCGLFYLLSLDDGLATNNFMEHESPILKELVPRWYDDFATHFAIVSVIIYAILLIATMIGIYFPARKIAKISPVDALRDE